MKRLLYLSNLRLPTEKAYGIQIAKMCEAFAEAGVNVELVYPYRKNPIKADIFDYYSIKKIFKATKLPALDFYFFGAFDKTAVGLKSFISAVALVFYALFKKSDIIYSRDELVLFLLSFFKKNLVFEAHRFSPKRSLFYNRFNNSGIKSVAISEAVKKGLVNAGFAPNNILVAPDGVDLILFDINISKESARVKVNLPDDKKIVLYSGHLFEWKGARILLETAKLISNFKFPAPLGRGSFNKVERQISNVGNILFVFIGGTEHDIKSFRKKAEGLDNVLILGHKPHSQIPTYLKAADVLVLPNSASDKISSYTSPLKLFEYMASGRPIIASDLPSIREILNNQNSVLVKPDDPENMARGIGTILDDIASGDKLTQEARQDVENYTWQKRVEKIMNFVKLEA